MTDGPVIIDLGRAASVIKPITSDNAVSQYLIGVDGKVRLISFMVGTYARVNRS